MPLVSIITPLFNKEPYVGDTIRSVLAQSMADWEMIVVENGSTDGGPGIVRQFSDPRIKLVTSPKRGPGAARNFGLRLATGEWILFLDADDILERDHLERLLGSLGPDAKEDLLIGRWRKFFASAQDAKEVERPSCEGKTHSELLDSAIVFAPWAIHAVLVRRSVLTPDLWWPEQMDGFLGEDVVFWFKLLNRTSHWVCSKSAGALYRWNTPGCRTRNEEPTEWFEGLHHAADENLSFLRRSGLQPTSKQCENLMRLYEGIYLLALRGKDRPIAERSVKLARSWLGHCLGSGQGRLVLVARQVVGFRIFNLLKVCVRFRA